MLEPKRSDADGLLECLSRALTSMGIEDLLNRENVIGVQGHPVLIGRGTDGASVNVSIKMECEERFKVLYLGYSGHDAMLISWNLCAKMPCPVSSSMILMTCSEAVLPV